MRNIQRLQLVQPFKHAFFQSVEVVKRQTKILQLRQPSQTLGGYYGIVGKIEVSQVDEEEEGTLLNSSYAVVRQL